MLNKSEMFNTQLQDLAEFAKILSHPARIQILQELVNKQSCTCLDIVRELPLAQSTVSQHLKAMKDIGLIEGQIDGPRVCYCINRPRMKELRDGFVSLFNKSFNKCC